MGELWMYLLFVAFLGMWWASVNSTKTQEPPDSRIVRKVYRAEVRKLGHTLTASPKKRKLARK